MSIHPHSGTNYRFVLIEIADYVSDDQGEDLQQHRAAVGLHGQEPPLSPHPEECDHPEVRNCCVMSEKENSAVPVHCLDYSTSY